MLVFPILAAVLVETSQNGLDLKVTSEATAVDPARSLFVQVELTVPADVHAVMPDLRSRVRGFSLAEDFEEPEQRLAGGAVRRVANWKLVPAPCAERYGIAPFVVRASPKLLSSHADDGKFSFWAGPVRFEPPAPREPVTGEMECAPEKDLPPLSWRLVGHVAAAAAGLAALGAALGFALRLVVRKVRERRMSPIERAWVELDRLLGRGLPGRGRYKDFYVELTMVVRRYVQRRYGIQAPHLTTEEFLGDLASRAEFGRSREALAAFLESADMVKFAGVRATPEMAGDAVATARSYLKDDSEAAK